MVAGSPPRERFPIHHLRRASNIRRLHYRTIPSSQGRRRRIHLVLIQFQRLTNHCVQSLQASLGNQVTCGNCVFGHRRDGRNYHSRTTEPEREHTVGHRTQRYRPRPPQWGGQPVLPNWRVIPESESSEDMPLRAPRLHPLTYRHSLSATRHLPSNDRWAHPPEILEPTQCPHPVGPSRGPQVWRKTSHLFPPLRSLSSVCVRNIEQL